MKTYKCSYAHFECSLLNNYQGKKCLKQKLEENGTHFMPNIHFLHKTYSFQDNRTKWHECNRMLCVCLHLVCFDVRFHQCFQYKNISANKCFFLNVFTCPVLLYVSYKYFILSCYCIITVLTHRKLERIHEAYI
jgi:hypothetical protein